jgi:hypothetical protein
MKHNTDLILLVVITFLLYTRPAVLVNFSNSLIGKAILLFIVVAASLHSTVNGLLLAMSLIILTEYSYEGFDNKDVAGADADADADADASDKNINDFRQKNCKSKDGKKVFVDSNGNEMDIDEIKKKYPHLKFNDGDCNPCDEECSFSISDAAEQITTDEALRPKDSSTMNVSRPNNGSV